MIKATNSCVVQLTSLLKQLLSGFFSFFLPENPFLEDGFELGPIYKDQILFIIKEGGFSYLRDTIVVVQQLSHIQPFLLHHGLYPTRLLCPWDFPGKNTGVGCHFLLQGIFLTQDWNLCPLHCQADSLPLSHIVELIHKWLELSPSPKTPIYSARRTKIDLPLLRYPGGSTNNLLADIPERTSFNRAMTDTSVHFAVICQCLGHK